MLRPFISPWLRFEPVGMGNLRYTTAALMRRNEVTVTVVEFRHSASQLSAERRDSQSSTSGFCLKMKFSHYLKWTSPNRNHKVYFVCAL
ncbi:hypothetical protein E2C01_082422 [Portunus trituberculatus]|uniref:Uncharacterized protein n=1 Tax=Portunus trituberculatus TaxID=210409 RepID=A0A5B7J0T8_PORTR|nr:hypothetical protein [Portunus trituberculatus]